MGRVFINDMTGPKLVPFTYFTHDLFRFPAFRFEKTHPFAPFPILLPTYLPIYITFTRQQSKPTTAFPLFPGKVYLAPLFRTPFPFRPQYALGKKKKKKNSRTHPLPAKLQSFSPLQKSARPSRPRENGGGDKFRWWG